MKSIWVPVIFATGLVGGVLLDRGLGRDTPANSDNVARPTALSTDDAVKPETANGRALPPSIAARTPAVAPPSGPGPIPSPAQPASEGSAAVDEGMPSQPIEVGPAFRKQFADEKKHGYHDQAADLHAALEREARDDSWSYPLEADIQNSLVSDTASGNFKAEHVECRSSMCEIRLSATDDQQAKALQKWTEGVHAQPWGSQIYMKSLTTISGDGRTDTLMLLNRPPKPAASN